MAGRVRRTLFRNPVETGLVIGLVYLLVCAGTATAEWWSERSGIGSGDFSESANPLRVAQAMTWPIHRWVTDPWPGYPSQFDAGLYRTFVGHLYKQTLGAALLEACLIALVIGAVGMALRSVRRDRQS